MGRERERLGQPAFWCFGGEDEVRADDDSDDSVSNSSLESSQASDPATEVDELEVGMEGPVDDS